MHGSGGDRSWQGGHPFRALASGDHSGGDHYGRLSPTAHLSGESSFEQHLGGGASLKSEAHAAGDSQRGGTAFASMKRVESLGGVLSLGGTVPGRSHRTKKGR